MKQTIEIEVPEGKKAIWKDNKVFFIDKPIELPKTWEEYCAISPKRNTEVYIGTASGLLEVRFDSNPRNPSTDRNLLPSEKDAKAHLALMQLHQLRDCYRQGWEPTDDKVSFGIARRLNSSSYLDRYMSGSRFLSFQSREIAEEFLKNFKNLIEQAKDLI